MNKTNRLKKTLSLSKETIRSLQTQDLVGVIGGLHVTSAEGNRGGALSACATDCVGVSCPGG